MGPNSAHSKEGQLLWNAMFAAFNVSARNLHDFMKDTEGNPI